MIRITFVNVFDSSFLIRMKMFGLIEASKFQDETSDREVRL